MRPALKSTLRQAIGGHGHSRGVGGIDGERFLQTAKRCRKAFLGEFVPELLRAEQQVIGIEVRWRLLFQPPDLGKLQIRFNGSNNARRDAVLQIEYVLERAVEAIRPDMGAVGCRR